MVGSLIEELKSELQKGHDLSEQGLTARLKLKVLDKLEQTAMLDPEIKPRRRSDGPLVVMVVGVNGVGKTTSVAKLSAQWRDAGAKVAMVAGDTFRAAAVDQLKEWGNRLEIPVISGAEGAKPGTVVFEAMERAKKEEFDVLIVDTAGRLHNKSNLMQELQGVRNIIRLHQPSAPHETLLVLDGTTGQNAISQAREFHATLQLTGLVITKLDGTPKGGVVVAIQDDLKVPVRYIGIGEGAYDLKPFLARDFVEALFFQGDKSEDGDLSANARVRRRRREEGVDKAPENLTH